MGWTVLYIAFGIVALWLLGEVLLQYKARLRWRALAFTGFLGVVLGVLMPNVFVIVLGAIAFAVGQTFVTLSFRRGFSTGWSLGGSPGASRRRKSPAPAADREPSLEVSDLEYEPSELSEPPAPPMGNASVYEPQPMPEDTGQYGVYNDTAYGTSQADQPHQPHQQGEYGGYDSYPGYEQPAGQGAYGSQETYANHDAYPGQGGAYPEQDAQDTYTAQDAHTGQDGYAGQDTYAAQTGYPAQGQDAYATQYDYGTEQQQYAAYSDPYIGSSNGGQQYGSYDDYGGRQQYADPYANQQYGAETPPGGVWVPQQRDTDQAAPPQDQSQQYGYDPNYNEQQHY
ncbi:hypothetical protein [Streptomyces sp. NPDC088725]|uniref:hypothetical protein n=1 Tax=Streptomyces sp. NPDC088725 TaxID=3365873 RepID=UPI003813CEE7